MRKYISLFVLLILFVITAFCSAADEQTNTSSIKGPVVGIDLGTTYSCVAIYRNGKVEIIPNEVGSRTTPSVISYNADGERLIGEGAKNNAPFNPENTLYDVKRLIGRRYKEILKKDAKLFSYKLVNEDGKVNIKVKRTESAQPEFLTPEEVSSQVLVYMKRIAEKYLGEEVNNAVITVPAYFNDQQRQATKDAGRIAGLNVLRIINEPTAASMAYGLDKKEEENILVFDLGGGTFDVSLLTLDKGVFEVIATSGDTHLGGEDFDLRIVEYFIKKFKDEKKADISTDKRAFQRLKQACEKAKRTLSSELETRIELDNLMNGIDFSEKLTRAKFEQLNADLFKKTMVPVQQVLSDGGMKKTDVDEVVLVGGSTRIPKIRELLQAFFRGKTLHTEVNPDEAIAYGAAVQAAILSGTMKGDFVLIDVTPLSLGIETMGGRMSVIIPRNTPLPADKSDTFTTTQDYQDRLVIPIYEGERQMTRYNRLLGEMQLTGIQPAPKGVPQIRVNFQLDQNGILKVQAIDEATKKANEITIQKGSLSNEEIQKMVDDAKRNERADRQFVETQKARTKLEQYARFINQKLGDKNAKYKLKTQERNQLVYALKDALKFLRKARENTRKAEYVQRYKKLKTAAQPMLFGDGPISDEELAIDDDDDMMDEDDGFEVDEDDQPIDENDLPIDDDSNQPIVGSEEEEVQVGDDKKKDEL